MFIVNKLSYKNVNNLRILLKQHYSTKTTNWNSVVGLEIHAQILSKSKLFSGAKYDFTGLVNDLVSPFDAAIPGTLPVLNKRCVEAGVLAALALSCKINPVSCFDRKHYFYADLPAGYQITQQRSPLAQDGELKFEVFTPGVHREPYTKSSKIKQIQLEQDSGKSLHDADMQISLIDLNRAGAPLMELVFEPDLKDGEEAAALVKELMLILETIGCCNCRMEEGALRVDANVSVNRDGEELGTRTEIKNISSVRAVAAAIKYEINRQIKLLEKGETIYNETRSWNIDSKKTTSMRDKEAKQDYRYMPEPNLPPLRLNVNGMPNSDLVNVVELRRLIPELPEETRTNLKKAYGLTGAQAIPLVNEKKLLEYFREICDKYSEEPNAVANFLLNDLLGLLNKHNVPLEKCNVDVKDMRRLINMKDNKKINTMILKKVLDLIVGGDKRAPEVIVKANNWELIDDPVEIEKICLKVLNDAPKLVEKYKRGNAKALLNFTSILSKQANSIDMSIATEKLIELLKKE